MQVFCDFDGTISIQDATDYVLQRLALPEWEVVEQQWKQGKIGSGECMQRQIALLQATQETLDATLDEVQIDDGFIEFVAFCRKQDIPVSIISDGVDYFIRRILSRFQLDTLPVIANRLSMIQTAATTHFRLDSPYADIRCASAAGVCKCRAIQSSASPLVYIGDGRSDFCVSDKPDIVFAKVKLAEFCKQEVIAYTPYRQFTTVTQALQSRVLAGGRIHKTDTRIFA